MADERVVEYIKEQKRQGRRMAEIEEELLQAGWTQEDMSDAMQEVMMDPPSYMSPDLTEDRKRGLITRVVVGVFVVLVIVVTVYFVFFRGTGDVFASLFEGFQEAETVEYSFDVKMEASGGEDSLSPMDSIGYEMNFSGATDARDADNVMTDLSGSIGIDVTADGMDLGVSTDADLVITPEELHLRLNKVPTYPGYPDFSEIEGTWAGLDITEVEEVDEAVEEQEDLEVVLTEIESAMVEMEPFDMEHIGSEDMNGRDVDVYEFESRDENSKEFFELVYGDILEGSDEEVYEMLDQSDIDISGEIWVGQDDGWLYRLSVDVDLIERDSGDSFMVETDLRITSYNEDVQIEVPESTLNLGEIVMAALFSFVMDPDDEEGDIFNEGDAESRDAQRMTDMRLMSVSADRYLYATDGYPTLSNIAEIENILSEEDLIFPGMSLRDPQSNEYYGWIDNSSDATTFCAYAELESGQYLVAYPGGNREVPDQPVDLSCGDHM